MLWGINPGCATYKYRRVQMVSCKSTIDGDEEHITQHTKDKLSHWLLSSVALPAILVPRSILETGLVTIALHPRLLQEVGDVFSSLSICDI
jgi:hypothetical protein